MMCVSTLPRGACAGVVWLLQDLVNDYGNRLLANNLHNCVEATAVSIACGEQRMRQCHRGQVPAGSTRSAQVGDGFEVVLFLDHQLQCRTASTYSYCGQVCIESQ